MTHSLEYLTNATLLGVGATALMDLWGILRQPLFGFARLDHALVGRWFGYMARGRFRHQAIAAAPAIRRERLIGVLMHYLIGIVFAGALLALEGLEWVQQPTLAPALAVGIVTLAAPLLLMQPAMGAGIAASRAPRPWWSRLQSLLSHLFFGGGLYLAALVVRRLALH